MRSFLKPVAMVGGASASSSARRFLPCGVFLWLRWECSANHSDGDWKGEVGDAGLAGSAICSGCRGGILYLWAAEEGSMDVRLTGALHSLQLDCIFFTFPGFGQRYR